MDHLLPLEPLTTATSQQEQLKTLFADMPLKQATTLPEDSAGIVMVFQFNIKSTNN